MLHSKEPGFLKINCILVYFLLFTGQSFAKAPIEVYPGPAVEAVADSSRYFVIKIQEDGGMHCYIGSVKCVWKIYERDASNSWLQIAFWAVMIAESKFHGVKILWCRFPLRNCLEP